MKTKEMAHKNNPKENGKDQPAKKSKIALFWEKKDRPVLDIIDMRAVMR
jgi:hypothetical protein